MIVKLDHTNAEISNKIRAVFQASYPYEAELLQVTDFPPLNRTLEEFTQAKTQFYGIWKQEDLAAAMEIRQSGKSTLIQSLVVHPNYFRLGLGGELVQFALDTFPSELYLVETGAANQPAIQLYEKYGFSKILEYVTDHGITKVRFEKNA